MSERGYQPENAAGWRAETTSNETYAINRPLGEFDRALEGITMVSSDKNTKRFRIDCGPNVDPSAKAALIKALMEAPNAQFLGNGSDEKGDLFSYTGEEESVRSVILKLAAAAPELEAIRSKQ